MGNGKWEIVVSVITTEKLEWANLPAHVGFSSAV